MIKKILIGPADKIHIDDIKIYDSMSLGFDYLEHLIRKCFKENGSDANVYLIYEDFKKSVGFDIDKIYPRDKKDVVGKKTLSVIEGKDSVHMMLRNTNTKIKKSLHWEPFLSHYCNHEYWEIEYKKFLQTLPHYSKVFEQFNYGHIRDNENRNNWLLS